MTKLRKKLLLSVLTLALTFIALGSTTFAWFTLGNDAKANAFTGTVQGGQGIDIAFVDTTKDITTETGYKQYNWTMSIDLATKIGNQLVFEDLTSQDGREITLIDSSKTDLQANKQYVEVSFYVRSMGELSALNLTSFIDVESNNFDWNPDATVEGANGFTVNTPASWNALNALRVSFTVGKNTLATNVFEFNYKNNHGTADDTKSGIAYKYAEAKKHNITCPEQTAVLKDTVKVGTVEQEKANKIENIALNNPVNLLKKGESATADIVTTYTLEDGVTYNIYQVTLRVWMEGWDGDCINAILTKSVKLGFALKATYANQQG